MVERAKQNRKGAKGAKERKKRSSGTHFSRRHGGRYPAKRRKTFAPILRVTLRLSRFCGHESLVLRKHAETLPGAIASNLGLSILQRGIACGQRGWK
jgi:hypothetical protein